MAWQITPLWIGTGNGNWLTSVQLKSYDATALRPLRSRAEMAASLVNFAGFTASTPSNLAVLKKLAELADGTYVRNYWQISRK